jgi:hypothetical protein
MGRVNLWYRSRDEELVCVRRVGHLPMRANRLFLRLYLLRGAQLWVGTRALLTAVIMYAGADPLRLSAGGMLVSILLSVAVNFAAVRRNQERVMLGNMGFGPLFLGALFAAPALVGELAIRFGAASR